jgi:REP element-mobilizing transposase RayT
MARPLRIQFPGAFYHITCRGIERRRIYADDNDRHKFLALLTDSLETYQVVLYAYILMSNHFHLLIQTRKANCSEFMRHFNICYTGWFNWCHNRCGNLYQGRYKAYLIDADSYLLEVSRYLHLNSVRIRDLRAMDYERRWPYAQDYRWCSLPGYLNKSRIVEYIDYDFILDMVGSRRAYRGFVLDGLKRDMENPFTKVKSRIILGDDDFATEVKRYLQRGSCREQPSYRDIVTTVLEPEVVLGILQREYGIGKGLLQRRGAHGVLRGIAAELLYKYCEITQVQIGQLLGDIDYMSVCQLRKRLKGKMQQDAVVMKRYSEIEALLKRQLSNV